MYVYRGRQQTEAFIIVCFLPLVDSGRPRV